MLDFSPLFPKGPCTGPECPVGPLCDYPVVAAMSVTCPKVVQGVQLWYCTVLSKRSGSLWSLLCGVIR